jgi:PAS domain S-box-containing protein
LDGSTHIEQTLMQEIQVLQARVHHLENIVSLQNQPATNPDSPIHFVQAPTSGFPLPDPLHPSDAIYASSSSTVVVALPDLLDETSPWTVDSVFETITDGLAVYDAHGNVVRANAAFRRMIGIDALSQSLQNRITEIDLRDENGHPYSHDALPLVRLLAGETIANDAVARVAFLNPAGLEIKADISGAPIRDAHGAIIGAVTIFRDVTERRNQERALLEANQRMDEFLSIASHELRTPLTTINGNIQLAKRRVQSLSSLLASPPQLGATDSTDYMQELSDKFSLVLELLNRAERQVHIQNRLVNELLDVSRIQSNRLELHMLSCDLASIVREVVEDQRAAHPDRTITFASLPSAEIIPIYADADRIAQVITNFLTNALKYSASDQPVALSIDLDASQVRLSVRDRGPGISQEEQTRLWERFYRVPGVTVQSGSGVGLGLGLYICRTIIDSHNGQIGVQSTPGVGSTFWFSLPVLE